jgi:hypothetical protein
MTYGLVNVHFIQPEFGLTMALIPALAILMVMTVLFTRSENTIGAVIAIVSSTHPRLIVPVLTRVIQVLRLGEMAYLVSRIRVLEGHGFYSKTILKDEMLLFASVSLALATMICLTAMVCVSNFNKGMKPLLQRNSWKGGQHEFEPVNQHHYAERIELD